MRAPLFWNTTTLPSTLLLPFANLYALAVRTRNAGIRAERVSVPVICVGNLVAGGAGKTPVALALGAIMKEKNIKAHFLSRGYKGKLSGPVLVDPNVHTAEEVGDEPLLLARVLPCLVSDDRVEGAKAAIAAGAKMIIMDDGFQNRALYKDVSLLVCDGAYGFGNGRLLPAGPLRESIEDGMARASAVIIVGDDHHGIKAHVPEGKKIVQAHVKVAGDMSALAGKTVVAFSGIARPHKFYHTLQQIGCSVAHSVAFADHYTFTASDLASLRAKAEAAGAQLVTTEKDFVRLPVGERAGITAVPIATVFEDTNALMKIVLPDEA